MLVVDKPAPVRILPLLTSRYLLQRRIRLPTRKYHPNNDSPKIPFFSDDEETPCVPKADAVFIPRENPRSLVIRPTKSWPSRASAEKASPLKDASTPPHENGKFSNDGSNAEDKDENPAENGLVKERIHIIRSNQKANGVHDDYSTEKEDSYMTISGHRAGEAAIVYEHGADIEALMPKLRRSDYFTEPRIQELAAKERAEPGYCCHVKDFVVGRHGYGSIKFLGETDVRRLDLESLVQFNNREVIVYLDDSKKPPVGQGLNKPAEVTLLNIKCFDKKTRQQYTEGPRVEKYKNMLKRKAEEQGAEFLSYDPIKGEWRFKVNHFSTYKLEDGDDDGEDKEHLLSGGGLGFGSMRGLGIIQSKVGIRTLSVETVCLLCKKGLEDADHLMWSCEVLKSIWKSLNIVAPSFDLSISAKICFATTFSAANEQQRQMMALSLWGVWYSRNKMLHEGIKFSMMETLGFLKGYNQELNRHREILSPLSSSLGNEVWKPPDLGFTKINFDAAFQNETKIAITAVLARNSEGNIVGAETYLFRDVSDAFVAEAKACERALCMAATWGFL
ncbi:nuclear pore complex protein NUP98A-like isoform X2 [Gossypium australe]|uniref:Nuclear pore complex protein NUP98A-like isoform X2 n=1 Tax=Gossypium australe TaxID=47621 RepID=A0A5B6W3Y0_9ROSI|nr:nuclear pore complex protein NUP98A-like isoform X2 [Gossypium australe]